MREQALAGATAMISVVEGWRIDERVTEPFDPPSDPGECTGDAGRVGRPSSSAGDVVREPRARR
jgi:hypothetical protein